MSRVPRRRLWTRAAGYHVMNRDDNREAVFADASPPACQASRQKPMPPCNRAAG